MKLIEIIKYSTIAWLTFKALDVIMVTSLYLIGLL